MGITKRRADRHIEEWEAKLSAEGCYPYRARWPSRLFHHSPIENIAVILTRGNLLSRSDSGAHRKLDIAGASVIQHRDRAHQFGRLYFRPRTPTQYCIEGISLSLAISCRVTSHINQDVERGRADFCGIDPLPRPLQIALGP